MPHAYYEILVRLSEAPGRSLRMSQLAEASASSKSRVSHAVARLEERGWVRRMDCPTDRRGQIAVLTDGGLRRAQRGRPGPCRAGPPVLFDALTAEQVGQLDAISAAILAKAASTPADADGCPLPRLAGGPAAARRAGRLTTLSPYGEAHSGQDRQGSLGHRPGHLAAGGRLG